MHMKSLYFRYYYLFTVFYKLKLFSEWSMRRKKLTENVKNNPWGVIRIILIKIFAEISKKQMGYFNLP